MKRDFSVPFEYGGTECYVFLVDIDSRKIIGRKKQEEYRGNNFPIISVSRNEHLLLEFVKLADSFAFSLASYRKLIPTTTELEYSFVDDTAGKYLESSYIVGFGDAIEKENLITLEDIDWEYYENERDMMSALEQLEIICRRAGSEDKISGR